MFRATDPGFSMGSAKQISDRIQHAFRNLEAGSPKDFPHTRNHDRVWNNAIGLIRKVDMINNESTFHQFHDSDKPEKISLKAIRNASRVSLHFIHLYHAALESRRISLAVGKFAPWYYLCGVNVDGRRVGWNGDVSILISPGSWNGIRMATFSSLIFAVQVTTESRLVTDWHMKGFEELGDEFY